MGQLLDIPILISHPVKEVIAAVQAKGIKVAIATGRMYCSALRFHQEIGSTLPLVAYQGAWIQDPNTQEIHRHLSVSTEIALQLLEYFEQPQCAIAPFSPFLHQRPTLCARNHQRNGKLSTTLWCECYSCR